MRLLVLGGTRFLGRHFVEAALAGGHEVTLFNRGLSHPDLFPEVERLRGDRDREDELAAAVSGRRWDAAVDCCAYRPEQVAAAAGRLAAAVERYVLISTISVYADFTPGPGEDAPRKRPRGDAGAAERAGVREDTDYGVLKALCEDAAEAAMPGRVLVVRPGLLAGPHDRTQRFAWWVRRVAAGGEVLAPGRPEHPLQVIDARDLASWLLVLLARRATGCFNATSRRGRLTFGAFLASCRAVAGSDARFTWVDGRFLAAHGVRPFDELPLWLPEEAHGFYAVDTTRAAAAGLTLRPVAHTIRAVLAEQARAGAAPAASGEGASSSRLRPEREADLLRAWHAR